MKKIVLTVIGGGSVNWMRTLMRDVFLLDEAEGGEIRLVDPNVEHAQAVAGMVRTFNRMRGKQYAVSVTPERRGALQGADFVMTTFSPGTMDAFFNDLEIPIKYGIRQPVSMTVGPCGISAAIRTAPVAYDVVQDMEKECPGAWLLNVTNPMSVVTRAMNLASTTVKVIGMCHEFHSFSSHAGRILGLEKPEGMNLLDYLYRWLPAQGLDYTVAGLNHFIWLTAARLNGKDVVPRIRQYADEHWATQVDPLGVPSSAWHNNNEAKLAYCRQFGYLPLAGDRHLVEFWPALCNLRNGFGMKYGVFKTTVDQRRHMIERNLAYVQRIAAGEETVDWTRSAEEMTAIMQAILTNASVPAIVNAPNSGQITNVPPDVVVETLATVSAQGIAPRPSGALPGAVGSLCRLHADVHELTVQASLAGSRALFVQALSLDPTSAGADFSEIGQMADDFLLANKELLPRFFDA
jgi:alpha-galactosidase/6-phospho-beta-glucosidase family protein